MNERQSLDGIWQLAFTMPESEVRYQTEVNVPCNVEPYLVSLGLVDDYMPSDDPYSMQIFESVDDWTYSTTFFSTPVGVGCRRELVLEGIDTIAEVYLNGARILDCCNMHLTYRVDVTERLLAGENELKIVIRSSELWAREHLHDMQTVSRDAATLYDSQSHLRKARHQWGWDNAPRLLTSGIVRSVYLEDVPEKRFSDVYLYTERISNEFVQLGANWVYQTPRKTLADHTLRLSLLDGAETIFTHTAKVLFVQGSFRYQVARDLVSLWWSRGFGDAKLYTVRLEMLEGDTVVATHEEPFGIRTLTLDWSEDVADGNGKFQFYLNGERVWIRGTNWKPLDPLASLADTKLKTEQALDELSALNCNMVRIWGGGIYEDPFFFDYCDRHGIMVWQDFMLACEASASDALYCDLMDAEARFVVKKYRNHPSLAVWCGDNENDAFLTWCNRGMRSLPSKNVISREILDRVTLACDPYRTYVPSSPFLSDRVFRDLGKPSAYAQAEDHLYVPVPTQPAALRACKSLFLGETGPIDMNAIAVNEATFAKESARAARLWNEAPPAVRIVREPVIHQSDCYFKKWRQAGRDACEHFYGRDFSFAEFRDYALAINFICAEVFKDLIEYCRVSRWSKTGVIWWSLMDMFPMLFNYSVIDSDHNRKLPYFWIRHSQETVALMGVRKELDQPIALFAVNDTLAPHSVSYTVTAYDEALNKTVLLQSDCQIQPNSSSELCCLDLDEKPRLLILSWTENGVTRKNHVVTGKTSFQTTRAWVEIIGKELGFYEDILEL